ncbi:MAG TPA: sigma-70 family RNA polymerase sigma factor [Candidatus Omnitrophota bacterium]|nr:sigma-70 family RNA polymerase sigma factor [Candidatus Omnitrophota bacterium]
MPEISQDVIRKASEGDVDAFEAVFRTYADYVFSIALRAARNHEDAQEITQDVFVTVYHKLGGFKFESGFKTWIYRVTVNMTINYLKKESKYRGNVIEYDDARGSPCARPEAYRRVDQEQREFYINKLLDALTPEQRACVKLRNIDGFTYEEIARELGLDINAVRSRLKRAREKLISLRKEVPAHEL